MKARKLAWLLACTITVLAIIVFNTGCQLDPLFQTETSISDDRKINDELKPPVNDSSSAISSVLGKGINVLEAESGTGADVNKSVNLFYLMSGDIRIENASTGFSPYTNYEEVTETSVFQIQKSSNKGASFGIGEGLPFGGNIGARWGGSSSLSQEGLLIQVVTTTVVAREYVIGGNSPYFWAQRLTQSGIDDFFRLSASLFLDKYDPFFITDANHGIYARMNYIYRGTTFNDLNQVSTGFKAAYNGFALGCDSSNSSQAIEFINNSFFNYFIFGGIADFQSSQEFYAGYKEWFSRATQSPGYVGSPMSGYMAVWQVFMALAELNPNRAIEIRQRAEAIRMEFYERSFARASSFNWTTVHTRIFSAVGNDKFILPAAVDGTPRQVIMYAWGAGGGGQGACISGSLIRNWYPGAGGGSGGAVRFGFLTTSDIVIDLFVAMGGNAGGKKDTSSSSTSGHTGDTGGNSWISYNGTTMYAFGGQGGGEPGSRNGGSPGSASSNPGPQYNHYQRYDGNRGGNGGSTPGNGGIAVSFDGYSGGSGARGGNQSAGSAGSNGLVVIKYFSFD
ncbi:MAG: hypothetical protein FWD14_06395 [Treponema sp.]|nr:hypothetical protein [Treponema sp.]